jgi:hypothetical protein
MPPPQAQQRHPPFPLTATHTACLAGPPPGRRFRPPECGRPHRRSPSAPSPLCRAHPSPPFAGHARANVSAVRRPTKPLFLSLVLHTSPSPQSPPTPPHLLARFFAVRRARARAHTHTQHTPTLVRDHTGVPDVCSHTHPACARGARLSSAPPCPPRPPATTPVWKRRPIPPLAPSGRRESAPVRETACPRPRPAPVTRGGPRGTAARQRSGGAAAQPFSAERHGSRPAMHTPFPFRLSPRRRQNTGIIERRHRLG